MKAKLHAIAGVLGFFLVAAFVVATLGSLAGAGADTVALIKRSIFFGTLGLIPILAGTGATGVGLLGERTDPLGAAKQKRGPIAFMITLLVLAPASFFLQSWARSGELGTLYYAVQGLELLASSVCLFMIGANIRDGLKLRGRIGASDSATPVIQERNGGPLVALRLPVLNAAGGPAVQPTPTMALCRCGASKNKPFCDGSHNEIGFNSNPSEDRTKDEVLVYEGKEVTVHYNRLLCSHAAECGRRQKAAFDSSRTPWIVPDNASKEGILDVVKACPSGALRYALPGEAPVHARRETNGVTVEKNGPYRVTGIPLASARQAEGANPDKYVLCRCGASKNKPFCDGSHVDIGWVDSNGRMSAQDPGGTTRPSA